MENARMDSLAGKFPASQAGLFFPGGGLVVKATIASSAVLGVGLWVLLASAAAAQQKGPGVPDHLSVAPGFRVERVAGPPLVNRPIHAVFDEQGRLYVTDVSGSNENLSIQLKKRPHRVVRLEDRDGDGRFEHATVFADRLPFPEGAMWYRGSLYVAAPPSIWRLTDTDGDGVADHREEWFQGRTLTHCGNDLHGPFLGRDGWIYWCKGAFATQEYPRLDGKTFVTRAAHIFRAPADAPRDPATGSIVRWAIEPVMSGGMDNPVDVDFTPGGERIFTTTFLVRPGGGLRDGLIHAIYGGLYGKRQPAIQGHIRTGELMPVLLHMGAAAPCGLTCYEGTAFGPEYRFDFFACSFNLHKVIRLHLVSQGATFRPEVEDLLSSTHPDFHPTDVIEDADGSLLVVDTGGWYKLCCPTSQLAKPDVLGGIYRVRRVGAPRVEDPRGLQLPWQTASLVQVVRWLDDPRTAVRHRAIDHLAQRGAAAVPVLAAALKPQGGLRLSPLGRTAAVWALVRIKHPQARTAVRTALADPEATVRQAALHGVALHRDAAALPHLIHAVVHEQPALRRVAAEALGRIGSPQAVPALLQAAARHVDRVLEHSIIYALIEIGHPQATAAGLQAPSAHTRRAALIALDQMPGDYLQPRQVLPLLGSHDPVLRTTAEWIVDHRPQWAPQLVPHLRRRLALGRWNSSDKQRLHDRLVQFGRTPAVAQLMAQVVRQRQTPTGARRLVLEAMAASGRKELPADWAAAVLEVLKEKNAQLQQAAVQVLRALKVPSGMQEPFRTVLLDLGGDEQTETSLRLQALAAVPGGVGRMDARLLQFVASALDRGRPVPDRQAAIEVLRRARLNTPQMVELTRRLQAVSPLDVQNVLGVFNRGRNEAVGRALVAALKQAPARSALRLEELEKFFARFPKSVQQEAQGLYEQLRAERADQLRRLEELLAKLPPGDPRRGQLVFRSSKAACSACHAIGYLGGRVGPDLTRIARVRTRRDLLESIIFPSASLVRSYEPVQVLTDEGKVYNGLVQQETPEELVLVTGPNQQVRIPRESIELMRPSQVSVMPAGLDKVLSLQELADLLSFLESAR